MLAAILSVTLVSAGCLYGAWRMLRSQEREHARREIGWAQERRDLLDRIMFLTDKTWALPPADVVVAPEEEEEPELLQDPLYYLPHEIV